MRDEVQAEVRVFGYSSIEGQIGLAPNGQELALMIPPLPEKLLKGQRRGAHG